LKIANKDFDFQEKTYVMGILNITPDSFSDGGKYSSIDLAIIRAKEMVEEGAHIIDIGAESTRPGSEPVLEKDEIERIVPVVRALVREIDIPISIDTSKAQVARRCLEEGAHIINDITGLKGDSKMAEVIAKYDVPSILMHIKGTPKTMQDNPTYKNLISEIKEELEISLELAKKAGIDKNKIILDPGIGFGKTFENNLEILNRLEEFKDLGHPLLVGASRKGFIGQILGTEIDERLEGSLAVAITSSMKGARILRVHDVKETSRALKVADKINFWRES